MSVGELINRKPETGNGKPVNAADRRARLAAHWSSPVSGFRLPVDRFSRLAAIAIILTALMPSYCRAGGGVAACAGDCNADGGVAINELIVAVNVALGTAALDTCAAVDVNGDGLVDVGELVRAVVAATQGCEAAVDVDGTCLQPGPNGLQPCSEGSEVRLLRCDDPATCLEGDSGFTVIDIGAVGATGAYSFSVEPRAIAGEIIVLDTVVDPSAGTVFRVIDIGPAAAGAALRRGVPPALQTLERLIIDPSSEAAVRLIQECGLENLRPNFLSAVTRAARTANQGTDFSGLTAAQAADLATAIARGDLGVQEALFLAKRVAEDVTLLVTNAVARPGDVVQLAVLLRASDDTPLVVGAENELTLDPRLTLLARADGTPDCAPLITHPDRVGAFAFRPRGCTVGQNCTGLKAVVFDTEFFPFHEATFVYTCRVRVGTGAAPGDAPIACSAARYSPPPPAPLPAPTAGCTDGSVTIVTP